MSAAARAGDGHHCAIHGDGPVDAPASKTVQLNGRGAARAGDPTTCKGKDPIVTGSSTVQFNGRPAARANDHTAHPGHVSAGSSNIDIGGPPAGITLGNPAEGEKMCQAAKAGRHTPGKNDQSYENCGVESVRQLVNYAKGLHVSEDDLLLQALKSGNAGGSYSGKWPFRQQIDSEAGDTNYTQRQSIARYYDVGLSTDQPQSYENIAQALSEGRGVITANDVSVLWGGEYAGSHAVVVTGMEFDQNGRATTVIYNDTGKGTCSARTDVVTFIRSLQKKGPHLNVTTSPIYK
jgi:uncharacterized Zn-binding protein involved in type VI secretion